MGKIQQVPSAAGALSALISRRFATKRYTCTRDEDDGEDACLCGMHNIMEGDDDELEESDCFPRLL